MALLRHVARNAVAYVALFIALGGTSYAALRLPANSVGNKQLKNGAVTAAKVKPHSLLARNFKPGQLPRGPIGPQGAKGDAGSAGAQGPKGDPGTSALSPLPSGQTETGTYAVGGPSYTAGSTFIDAVTFQIPLASALDSSHVVYVTGASATHCPGAGQAESGYLCAYETTHNSIDTTSLTLVDPTSSSAAAGASKNGFFVAVSSVGTNPFVYAWGTWAVTG
jgi:hypothetical protein